MISFEFVVFISLTVIIVKVNSNETKLFYDKERHYQNKYFADRI